jgi:hypothetical protein
MTEVVDEYVAADYAEAKRLVADALPVAAALNEQYRLTAAYGAVRALAYKLDEAVAALRRYSEDSFWQKVPSETYAENDKGAIAKTAIARIFPV